MPLYTYITRLKKIGSGIQKLMWEEDTQTAWISHKPTLGKHAKNEFIMAR
jgi:hypothetical protein